MELLIIIIQEEDYPGLSRDFIRNKIHATRFCTTGLYLNKPNVTLMVCIEKDREEEVLGYIRSNCKERTEERQVSEFNGVTMVDVVRSVKIGGATVMKGDLEALMKF